MVVAAGAAKAPKGVEVVDVVLAVVFCTVPNEKIGAVVVVLAAVCAIVVVLTGFAKPNKEVLEEGITDVVEVTATGVGAEPNNVETVEVGGVADAVVLAVINGRVVVAFCGLPKEKGKDVVVVVVAGALFDAEELAGVFPKENNDGVAFPEVAGVLLNKLLAGDPKRLVEVDEVTATVEANVAGVKENPEFAGCVLPKENPEF